MRQRDEAIAAELRANGRDPLSEKRAEVSLSPRWKLGMPRLLFTQRLSFCPLSDLDLGDAVLAAPLHQTSSVPISRLFVEQLVMPTQILSNRGHAFIAHQFL